MRIDEITSPVPPTKANAEKVKRAKQALGIPSPVGSVATEPKPALMGKTVKKKP